MTMYLKPASGGQTIQVLPMTSKQSKQLEKNATEYIQLKKQEAELHNKISGLNNQRAEYQENILKARQGQAECDQNILNARQGQVKCDQNISEAQQKKCALLTTNIEKSIKSLEGQERALKSKGITINQGETASSSGQVLLFEVTSYLTQLNSYKSRLPNESEAVWKEFSGITANLQNLPVKVREFLQPKK